MINYHKLWQVTLGPSTALLSFFLKKKREEKRKTKIENERKKGKEKRNTNKKIEKKRKKKTDKKKDIERRKKNKEQKQRGKRNQIEHAWYLLELPALPQLDFQINSKSWECFFFFLKKKKTIEIWNALCFFCLSFFFDFFQSIFLFFQFLVFFLSFFFLFSSLFLCFFFSLSIYFFNSQWTNGTRSFSVTTPEEAASMVRQLHGRPTPRSMSGASPNSLIRCNTWCESSSVAQCASPCAPSHCRARAQRPGCSRYFWVAAAASKTFAWQWTEAVFVNKRPVNKVNYFKTKELQ